MTVGVSNLRFIIITIASPVVAGHVFARGKSGPVELCAGKNVVFIGLITCNSRINFVAFLGESMFIIDV